MRRFPLLLLLLSSSGCHPPHMGYYDGGWGMHTAPWNWLFSAVTIAAAAAVIIYPGLFTGSIHARARKEEGS
ncbi:MAG: hypothetical protein JRI97_07290, partial [Deltaproteobacteria bacterium]|nr:hypothetical protein [Deltaproteobacteria bacterium]